ncbi:MAG TPA: FtsX-like permease family protein [Thermoanaerobaculia bacterium]|nr:FtsX-like permease family protein [Thermoanaerobaculia bacterium]
MYARLLLESLRHGTRRKLLAVTAVALGTLGATALGEVMLASGDRVAAELASYGANLELVPGPGRETLAAARLAAVRRIFWRNNIVALAPLYPLRLRLRLSPRLSPDAGAAAAGAAATGAAAAPPDVIAEVIGTWFHYPLESGFRTGLPATRPTLQVAGRWPHDDLAGASGAATAGAAAGGRAPAVGAAAADGAEAVLGRRLAARLHLGAGGRLRAALGERSVLLAVTGIVTSGGEEDEQAFVPLAVVSRLAGLPGRFVRAEIFAQTNPESGNVRDPRLMTPREYEKWYCTAYPSSVAFQLRQALPEAEARVVSGVTAATAAVLGKLRVVLLALAVVALVGAAVGVTAAMTATVLERRLEAALMVAIGAARRRVVTFFLLEAALLGGLGGLLGGGLGLVAGRLLGAGALGIEVQPEPVLLPFAVLLGLVVAVLASAPPVSRALGRYPAALLKRATA